MSSQAFRMHILLFISFVWLALPVYHASAFSQPPREDVGNADPNGRWIYRSFRPFLPLHTPFNDIKFGEGLIEFNVEDDRIVRSSLDMGNGYLLIITGNLKRDESGSISEMSWRGLGVPGTATDGWIYDYKAYPAPTFPQQTNHSLVLIGQTVRTVRHGPSPPGVTGPFFMTRESERPSSLPSHEVEPRMSLTRFAEFDKYEFEFRDNQFIKDGRIETRREMVVTRDDRSPESKRRLESLMRGVRVMKSRRPSDPTSWFFQAAVHGASDEAIREAADRDPGVVEFIRSGQADIFWNQCPHNGQPSADFLVWHRAYLYHFERILRDASGDPTLSLPYWDYTGEETSFPEIFQLAQIASMDQPSEVLSVPTNPLYDPDREFAIAQRGATQLQDRVTRSWDGIEGVQRGLSQERLFFGPSEDKGFAGGVYDDQPSTKGMIEVQPHDNVHIAVGGIIGDQTGRMADVMQAAFDPIFWVHHANIDRLWVKWDNLPNREWGYFPNATWFVAAPWAFFDTDGQIKKFRRSHFFNNSNLGVSYADAPNTPSRLTAQLPFDLQEFDAEIASLASKPAPLGDSDNVPLFRPSMLDEIGGPLAFAETFEPALRRPREVPQRYLEIQFTAPQGVPNVGFDVMVSYKTRSGESITRRVGGLGLFGAGHRHGSHNDDQHAPHGDGSARIVQRFNVTALYTEPGFRAQEAAVSLSSYPLTTIDGKSPKSREGHVRLINARFLD